MERVYDFKNRTSRGLIMTFEIAFTIWLFVIGAIMLYPIILDIYKICKGVTDKK